MILCINCHISRLFIYSVIALTTLLKSVVTKKKANRPIVASCSIIINIRVKIYTNIFLSFLPFAKWKITAKVTIYGTGIHRIITAKLAIGVINDNI